jgi:phenylpropionate dioxygenase-like ring-hydroxylating dioxygenase large terminal subunit
MTTALPEAEGRLAADRVVDNRVYSDPEVYRREVERVFGGSWLFVCHESEIANVGDFVATSCVGSPVLVTRDHDKRLRAYFNVCRHRGCRVVNDDRGHASAFRCPYHFWVYSLEGELVGLSGEETYEGSGFRKEDHPLVELACDAVYGLVFIHLGEEPPPLTDWLGPEILDHLATPLANADLVVVSHDTWELPINWKIFAENVRDGYHVPFVHPFFRKASPPGPYVLHRNGHAFQSLGMDPNGIEPDLWAKIRLHPLPGVEEGEGYIANLFPDANVTLRSNVVSLDTQRTLGIDRVVIENRTLGLAGDGEEVAAIRRLAQETWFKNPVELEDMPIFLAQQEGITSPHVRYSVIARGRDATTGTRGDDNRLRHFWTQWRAAMGTEANSIDPAMGGA